MISILLRQQRSANMPWQSPQPKVEAASPPLPCSGKKRDEGASAFSPALLSSRTRQVDRALRARCMPVRLYLVIAALALLLPSLVRAQLGNDNPTGPAGTFNGNVTTACSYDAYTGSATRSVTDLAVAGSVGRSPLAFTRMANSRNQIIADYGPMSIGFGKPGLWQHSYQWAMDGISETNELNYQPTQYNVYFPDGRNELFTPSSSDSCFRAAPGVRDRFQPLDWGTMRAYLIFPDGGKVEFTATRTTHWNFGYTGVYYSISYQATGIIDPYGQRTVLAYNWDGTLNTIQEPAGRWLQIIYMTPSWTNWWGGHDRVIDHVQASDGRVVQYNYANLNHGWGTRNYTHLVSVVYPTDPGASPPTAHYTYQSSNYSDPYGGEAYPLLRTCDDPMYQGPMKRIAYVYATANDDGSSIVPGQIRSENYFDGVNIGPAVSTLAINSSTTRTETRGDGPSRTFNYDGGKLVSYTDFKGQLSTISYDGYGYVWAVTDARGNATTTLREGAIGAISVLTHPDQSIQGYAYWYADGAPYHVQIRGDERGHNTYFTRDANFRLTRIDYPDYPTGAFEEYTYNGFGQVLTHRMTSRGTESFNYDGRGMMYASTNPDGTTYYYDGNDRLEHVTDARSNTTWFQYNARGQTTRVTHMDGSFVQFVYNSDGTMAWTADENHPDAATNPNHRTRYSYDDYKRIVSVTNPLNQTSNLSYAPWNGTGSYSHTTSSVYHSSSPAQRVVDYNYDENFRRTVMRQAPETDDDAWTWFGYDAAGNMTSTTDPRNVVITFGYDNRNRQTSATNGLSQTTIWQYDATNNVTRETRPDQSFRRAEFDSMNRVIDTYGFANEHTHYDRDLAGNVHQMVDPKGAGYVFYYDAMNRKASEWYPVDATGATRYDYWERDGAGNIVRHDNPAGNVQIFEYDNRNRLKHSYWWGNVGPDIVTSYDAASRVTNLTTNWGETSVSFGYDDANRKSWEEQTVDGSTMHRLETDYDADGNRAYLHFPGWYLFRYDYTQRSQLAHIYDGNSTPIVSYTYDVAGNMTKRQNVVAGVNDSANSPSMQYDPLNRPVEWENTGSGDNAFARSWQQYDNLGRMRATWRDEQASKGERFGYDTMNQLTSVAYNADQVWTGSPLNATRNVTYNVDALNRQSVNENGTATVYSPNGLNQYTGVGGVSPGYDDKFNLNSFNGLSGSYDAANHLVWAGKNGNGAQFIYDGLGRCLKRTINGATTIIGYDGWKPTVEWDGNGAFQAWNIYGTGPDEILWRNQAGVGYLRYHHDVHGNVAYLLGFGGEGLEKYSYDAFGAPTITDWNGNVRSQSAYGNRFMFTGREYFPELGLYDFRNRFYHPGLGRFLQSDPTGFDAGDANLFRYCGGDPVNASDPLGLETGIVDYDPYDGKPIIGYEIPEDPFAHETLDLWRNTRPLDSYLNNFDVFGEDPFRVGNNIAAPQPLLPLPTLPQSFLGFRTGDFSTGAPATSVTFAFGPGIGIQVTVTWDKHGQSFISIGGQVGKSWPYSASMTSVSLMGQSNPTASEIAANLRGLGWSGSAGAFYFGGQLGGPASWSIFNPFNPFDQSGAGPPSTWGVGFMTPQGGLGLGYTWQLPTLANPLPPYSSPKRP
jgi:RHS repeat-associated protein